MRFFTLIPDGAPEKIERGTPLELANTEFMDSIAPKSLMGLARTIPEGFPPGSDVGTLSLLGFPPQVYAKGRAPLEIASKGIDIPEKSIIFRMNFVTINGDLITDHSANHISDEQSRTLVEKLKLELRPLLDKYRMSIHFGKSYRNYLVWQIDDEQKLTEVEKAELTPPHDILGQNFKNYLPKVPELLEIMKASVEVLKEHPTAKMVWFWGHGRKYSLPKFEQKYGRKAYLVSAVDIIKGIGRLAGIEVLEVEGITGYLDSNFEGKVNAILENTKDEELGIIHVEATDETGHEGNYDKKKLAIEIFDRRVLGNLLKRVNEEDKRILIISDHPTRCDLRTHVGAPVPFMIYPCICNGKKCSYCGKKRFTELYASETGIFFDATLILKFFLKKREQ